ncbi:Sensor protein ZraS [bacterium HR21]|nr:Sensor protein ZraS [bacterium HR21]
MRQWHFYALVTAIGAVTVVLSFVATQRVVRDILARERQTVQFYAEMLRIFADPTLETDPFLFVLLDHVVPTISFPIVVTDPQDEPLYPYGQNTLNVELDTAWSAETQRRYLRRLVAEMRQEFPPISVTDQKGVELARIYYSTSRLVRWVRWIPYVQALLVIGLLVMGWIALRFGRQAEESRLWVAMAKEAAHQLGTPLSSVLGWLELLRQQPEMQQDILHELARDVARLQSVVQRFSQIGAQPRLTPQPIAPIVEEVVHYLQRRLPQSKHIEIELELDRQAQAAVNRELLAWAVENVLKNAIEAIERAPGRIQLRLSSCGDTVQLEITDNGRGIPARLRRRIFEPGFTTKRRGWGLGLSLARRIVESYHGGALLLKESIPGQGSTFVLELPRARSPHMESPRDDRREGFPELSR